MTIRITLPRALVTSILITLAGPSWSALIDGTTVPGNLPPKPLAGARATDGGRVRFLGLASLSHVTGAGDTSVSVYRGLVHEIGADGFGWFPGRLGIRARFVYEARADGSESIAFIQGEMWPSPRPAGEAVTAGGVGEPALRQALLDTLDPSALAARRLHVFVFSLPRARGAVPPPASPGPLVPSSVPVSPTAAPVPAAGGLLAAGLAALAAFGRRRRR